jgi:hypothetical protein
VTSIVEGVSSARPKTWTWRPAMWYVELEMGGGWGIDLEVLPVLGEWLAGE